MIQPEYSKRFKKEIKRYQHQPDTILAINSIIQLLLNKEQLPEKHRDHSLVGEYRNYRECHIKPDLLMIYRTDATHLYLARIGSHSALFC